MSTATRRKTAGRRATVPPAASGRKAPASAEMQLDPQADGGAERGEEPGDHEDEFEDGVDSDGMAAATGAAAAGSKPRRPGGQGRRKIPIEYVADKGKRAVTFSKRRAGLFTKARELSVLTGTALLLLVVSESGVVYTYTTEAFEPMVTQPSGKNLIAACLNGTVKVEPAPPVPRGSKRGGNVILRDAFSKPEDHESRPFASTSAPDGMPPVSAARGPRAQGARSDSSSPDTGSIYEHSGYGYALDPSFLHAAPSTELYAAGAGSESVQAPEKSAGTGRRVASPVRGAASASIPVTTDDVSEDECERRLRRLRRSLSLERRFENSDVFGNALPPLPVPLPQALPPLPEPRAGYDQDVGAGAGADAGPNQWRAVHDRFASQSTGERVGYAHTVDSWERFNRLNPIRSPDRSTSTTRRTGGQSLSLPALDETVSHPP